MWRSSLRRASRTVELMLFLSRQGWPPQRLWLYFFYKTLQTSWNNGLNCHKIKKMGSSLKGGIGLDAAALKQTICEQLDTHYDEMVALRRHFHQHRRRRRSRVYRRRTARPCHRFKSRFWRPAHPGRKRRSLPVDGSRRHARLRPWRTYRGTARPRKSFP